MHTNCDKLLDCYKFAYTALQLKLICHLNIFNCVVPLFLLRRKFGHDKKKCENSFTYNSTWFMARCFILFFLLQFSYQHTLKQLKYECSWKCDLSSAVKQVKSSKICYRRFFLWNVFNTENDFFLFIMTTSQSHVTHQFIRK